MSLHNSSIYHFLFYLSKRGGVASCPVVQVYGSLALKDNLLEVVEAVLDKCIVFPASAPVPSSSHPKKQTNNLQWVLLDFWISLTCKVGVASSVPRAPSYKRGLDWSYSWFLSLAA